MNNLRDCINEYRKDGYTRVYAISKVCQDIIINRIYSSQYNEKITIKGGVVMFHLTKNIRRATIDIDIDLINLSIATDNIVKIFIELSNLNTADNFIIKIDEKKIEELSHQDYHGKRITAEITDKFSNNYSVKIDVGVHKHTDISQEMLLLDTNIFDKSITFLANPKEQIFTEKLIPLLKFGILSTRYRDIFDIYWLITKGDLSKKKIIECIQILIIDNVKGILGLDTIIENIKIVLSDDSFIKRLSNNENWTNEEIIDILIVIRKFIDELDEK